MHATKRFVILGSGMQGTCAAYDLARFGGNAATITMVDRTFEAAQRAVDRVVKLVPEGNLNAQAVDVTDEGQLCELLQSGDVVLSCVPYYLHPRIAKVVLSRRAHMTDLGGNTAITRDTLNLDAEAKAQGVTMIPDTGLAPGLVNSLAMALMEQTEHPESVTLFCGVLPQNPVPPFNYKLTFNMEGLVTEYDYQALVLRDGELVEVDTLAELELVEGTPLGQLEAFTTSGGTSTAPETFQGQLQNYEYKTLRYPGHCALMRIFKDFGFWSEDRIKVDGGEVRPKDVFNAVFGPQLAAFKDRDCCVVIARLKGTHAGQQIVRELQIFDKEDQATGFTAMERLTGFSISIHALAIANGELEPGVIRYEQALKGQLFVERLRERGIEVKES